MRRLSSHCLLSLLMALVLAIAAPVAAGGHHGDAACLESLSVEDQMGWNTSETAEPSESHSSVASPCCLPCAQCGASMARLASEAVVSSLSLSGHDLGNPSGPPAPFERPPRV